MRSFNASLQDQISSIRFKVPGCCQQLSSSSSSSGGCPPLTQDIFDEWEWNQGIITGSQGGVDQWIGFRNGRILTTLLGRPEERRAKVEDGAIFSNGAEGFKTAYQASLSSDWYSGFQTAYSNALFFVVEIDLFKLGETVLWNHLLTGGFDNEYNSFSSQSSTNTIGTRLSGVYQSISRPLWMTPGLKRYLVEFHYGPQGSLEANDLKLVLNGFPLIASISSAALKNVLGLGIVAPVDYSANSLLNRRLLSILALKNSNNARLSSQSIIEARNYLACKWNILLQS